MTPMQPVRTAFVMEQALGHVTHAHNLRSLVAEREDIQSTWLPIPFDVQGASKLLPLYRGNWSVRASWRSADGVPPPTQPDVVAQFQTCAVPDGSIDRILDVVPA